MVSKELLGNTDAASQLLGAMSNPSRLTIMCLLAQREHLVVHLGHAVEQLTALARELVELLAGLIELLDEHAVGFLQRANLFLLFLQFIGRRNVFRALDIS